MLCVGMCVFFNVEKGPCDYRVKVLWIIEWKAQRETSATQMFQAEFVCECEREREKEREGERERGNQNN